MSRRNNATEAKKEKWTMDFVGIRNSGTSNIRCEKRRKKLLGKIKSSLTLSRCLCAKTIQCTRTRTFVITISERSLLCPPASKNHSVELCKSALTTSWLLLLSFRYFFFLHSPRPSSMIIVCHIRNCWHIGEHRTIALHDTLLDLATIRCG